MVYEDYDRFNDSTCISALPIRSPRSSAQKMLPQWNVNKLPPKDGNKNKIYLWPSIKEKSLTSGAFGPESRYIFIHVFQVANVNITSSLPGDGRKAKISYLGQNPFKIGIRKL